MPRLRARSIGLAGLLMWLAMGPAALAARQLGDDGGRGLHLVADRHARFRAQRKVEIDPRAEADEPVALSPREPLAGLHVAEDAPRDEARDLHAGKLGAVVHAQDEGVALVVGRRLVE